jgi:hypothetical protein
MRTRLLTALALVGLAVTGSLLTFARLSARDVTVPSEPQKACPATGVETCGQKVQVAEQIPTMIVNTRRIRLNYSVADVGPSGVSAIELWATRDGKTWQRYSNEPPPAGPLVVHVAEEGRYGFTIVVRSGTGLKSPPPETGDAPQLWVEVDETRPLVKIKDVHSGTGRDVGTLYVNYAASDIHLTPRPVSISMSTKKEGPWTTIASGLENTGVYGWEMPKDLPYQFYVRVEAEDRAGNVGAYLTSEPIKIDLARPRGTILGVNAEQKATPQAKPVEGFYIGFDR